MDHYPDELEPPRGEWEDIDKNLFAVWWTQVSSRFPTVPEEVAKYWLHEHWGFSPYKYLVSASYRFERVTWAPERVNDIASCWNEFKAGDDHCAAKGRELCTEKMFGGGTYKTAAYMMEAKRFPTPIVVLDNNDGHHNADYPDEFPLPNGYVLIEGHTRFNIASYLAPNGGLAILDVWLVKKASS